MDTNETQTAPYQHMARHLTAPFAAGALDTEIPISNTGTVALEAPTREPLVLIASRLPLEKTSLQVRATLDPDGAGAVLPPLEFFPYTEAQAFLPLYRPAVDEATRVAQPFSLRLTAAEVAPDGTETPVPAAQLPDRLCLHVLEGNLGRMIYILSAEKQRIRRQAREICAMRLLTHARAHALDQIGAELGVARLADEIAYDAARKEIVTRTRQDAQGNPVSEPDEEYRRRLAIYRRLTIATRRDVLQTLNGPGQPADANAGLLSGLGLADRFRVIEEDNAFALAIHVVSAGDQQYRTRFLQHLRTCCLVLPARTSSTDGIHRKRFLPTARKNQIRDLRARLSDVFTFQSQDACAPALATALDRVGRCIRALQLSWQITVFRTQDPGAGSRYELGLGADIKPFNNRQLDTLANRVTKQSWRAESDLEIEALLQSMEPRSSGDDPDGRWFLGACGLRTVHPVWYPGPPRQEGLYVSHLPTFGMVIDGPDHVNVDAQTGFTVSYHAPHDPGKHALLVDALSAALDAWTHAGGQPWTVLPHAQEQTEWSHSQASGPAAGVLQECGLPATADPGPVLERLARVPEETRATLRLDSALARGIALGEAESVAPLRKLLDALRECGVASALPLITPANQVLLVIGVIGLPGAGLNLSDRSSMGFRWYVIPLQGPAGSIQVLGSRTVYRPGGAGLAALVALGYARRGNTDPYEYRVEMADGATLNIKQYEFLMNMLSHCHPLGIEVNTFRIRRRHVDLDGDGHPDPLPPALSRTFRRFQRRRQRGEVSVNLDTNE